MAIEVNKKKKEVELPKGLDLFFQITIILLILTGAFYFFVLYLNVKAEEVKVQIVEYTEKKRAEIPEKKKLEEKAREYYNLIEDFKAVAENRQLTSLFFDPFENMIHPRAMLYDLRLEMKEDTVWFSGKAEDFVAVGQQFRTLKNRDFVLDVSLNELSVEEDNGKKVVNFVFQAEIDPEITKIEEK